ncbi:hypothetical protein AAG570_012352 [Ranatra chinensis]|uniref:Uncharacterized protein n=1 Tax=Ranatra chinensis TaxID=642074 RepID=A0ABD0YIJ9_9HEMI
MDMNYRGQTTERISPGCMVRITELRARDDRLRLCTSSEGSKMHIFREEGKRRQLSSKIQLCLPLQVNEEDSLPKIVCNDCVDKLESFFDFRSSCVNAEAMLEGYFTSLRYSNDFNKEGKVYVKDVSPCKGQECDNSKKSLEVTSSQTQMPTPGRGQGGKGPPVTSVPVTLDSLTNLVQAAAIQIVGQAEPEDNRLQQYKCAVQIQPGPVLESSNSDNRFTYQPCSNNPITTTTTVLKSVQAQHFVSPSKQDKSSEDEEHRVEEESSDDENETSLQPTIAFTSSNAGQDVLVHFDFNKEKESPQNVFHTSDGINRNSVVQIGEFLRMKTVEIETGDEVNVRTESNGSCEHCGKELTEEERESHSLTCSPLAENTLEEKANITYRCDICNKLFKRKEHLFQHKKLHTGDPDALPVAVCASQG